MGNHEYFGLKELNSVTIRAYSDMQIGTRYFSAGEPVLLFNKLQIGELSENSRSIFARGGYGNYPKVIWDQPADVNFTFTEGVLSKESLSILANAALFDYAENEKILEVSKKENLTITNSKVKLMKTPIAGKIFIYLLDEDDLIIDKITQFTISGQEIIFDSSYNNKNIMIDYMFEYSNGFSQYTIGDRKIDGYLTLDARARIKSEVDGVERTFLLEMPRIKITSNLDIIIGEKVNPTVSVFNIIGVPIKENGHFTVCRMNLLNEDIDSDI